MNSLELTLPTKTVILSLNDSLEEVRSLFVGQEISLSYDHQMGRVYLNLIGQGVQLLFQDELLSTIFLFMTKGSENCGLFKGSIDLLDRSILDSADEKAFRDTLERKGFFAPNRTYPFSIDRLNEEMRIRLEKRHGEVMFMIDDGSMVR